MFVRSKDAVKYHRNNAQIAPGYSIFHPLIHGQTMARVAKLEIQYFQSTCIPCRPHTLDLVQRIPQSHTQHNQLSATERDHHLTAFLRVYRPTNACEWLLESLRRMDINL